MESVKFKSFGKITTTNQIKSPKELEELPKVNTKLLKSKVSSEEDPQNIDKEIPQTLKKQQIQYLEKDMQMLENMKNSKGNAEEDIK